MPLNASGAAQAPRRAQPAERRVIVGLVFLLLVAAGVLFAVWLAQVQFARDYTVYDVELGGQVQGLSNGSAVFINGVRTGEVVRLALDPKNPSRVVARIRVSADAPVRRDSTAALEWLGVSGSRIIQLSGGSPSQPLLRQVSSRNRTPVIHSAARGPGGAPNDKPVDVQALEALDMLNQRLSDRNLEAIGESLVNARTIAGSWRANAKTLAEMDAQLAKTAESAGALARSAEATNGKVNGDLRRQLKQLADASAGAKTSIRNARTQIAGAQTAADAQLQTLPALTSRIGAVGGMVGRAGEVVERLESQQPQLMGAPAARELKVAP